MTKRTGFHVLVATDGSAQARVAVEAATAFPWPQAAHVHGLVARNPPAAAQWSPSVAAALDRSVRQGARQAEQALRARWPDAEVAVVNEPPVEAILARAGRLRAGAIVLGSRGHGPLSRLVLGSVSLGVVRRAPCPVLVVKGRLAESRRFVLGLDGSAHARRAVAFLARLAPPTGGRVTLVSVVEPVRPPSMGILPASVRALIGGEVARLEEAGRRAAWRRGETAAARLRRAGWTARATVRTGVPLATLLEETTRARADVLVLGARGVGGVERLLLGSVAEGALTRAATSVLIVK